MLSNLVSLSILTILVLVTLYVGIKVWQYSNYNPFLSKSKVW